MRFKPLSMIPGIPALLLAFALAIPLRAAQERPIPPAEALATFKLDRALRIELVAAEPEVEDPVAIAFDEKGVLYVAENRGYPNGPGEGKPPEGRIARLEDKDGDGRYETRTTFADGLTFPNGVMAWRGGLIVTCAPDVFHLVDTDGDGKADTRDVILTGFSVEGSTQLRVSHPTLAIDGWLYFTNALTGGAIISTRSPGREPLVLGGQHDLRMNPSTGELELMAGPAQFGMAFDAEGNRFFCSNRRHIVHAVFSPREVAGYRLEESPALVDEIPDHGEAAELYGVTEARTTAYSHQGTFTAACGLAVYQGDALPGAYRGNAFVCDPTANLIHRDVLAHKGGSFVASRAPGEAKSEFLTSTDEWCRPVFIANGPDGALYFCDIYRKTIEHPTYLPPEVAAVTDFDSGKGMGRIYRITAADAPKKRATPDFSDRITRLSDDSGWSRMTAERLILEAPGAKDAETLRALLRDANAKPLARLHALHMLTALQAMEDDDLIASLSSGVPMLRSRALRMVGPSSVPVRQAAREAMRQVAETPGDEGSLNAILAFASTWNSETSANVSKIVAREVESPWIRTAAILGTHQYNWSFAESVITRLVAAPQSDGTAEMLRMFGGMAGNDIDPGSANVYARQIFQLLPEDKPTLRFAALAGLAEAARGRKNLPEAPAPLDRIAATDHSLVSNKSVEQPLVRNIRLEIERALAIAGKDDASPALRIAAMELLSCAGFEPCSRAAAALLTPQTPAELQLAAVRAMAEVNDDRTAPLLLEADRWKGYRPAARTAALGALLRTAKGCDALLDALESESIPGWSVDASSRAALMHSADAKIAERAAAIFKSAGAEDRQKVYEEYLPMLALNPDPAAGAEVFRKTCAQCHRFKGDGYEVGPDLSDLRSHPPESILIHILIPNQQLLTGFENYVIETDVGETLSGLIKSESPDQVTLRGPLGAESTIARKHIKSLSATNLSLMPDELEKGMSKQELRDLIGYLKDGAGESHHGDAESTVKK